MAPTSTVATTSPSLCSTPNPPCDSHLPPPLPTIPIEIVEEIIIRFPVKLLSQLRCVCKSWNSMISDPKFARRHLHRLNSRILLVRFKEHRSPNINFMSYPLPSVLKAAATTVGTHHPLKHHSEYSVVGSCDGIICCWKYSYTCKFGYSFFFVWNPSTRKFWELPLLEEPKSFSICTFGFGYDNLSESFKLVVIFSSKRWPRGCETLTYVTQTHVMVHTLGSNSWRKIEDFHGIPHQTSSDGGKFVSGALNWLTCDTGSNLTQSIISLDLGKESFQEFLQPNYGMEVRVLTMDVMRDCLCILANSDVWVMKEYGNSESWTKLFSFSSNFLSRVPLDSYRFRKHHLLCVLENDESLVYPGGRNVYVYSHKDDTFRRSCLEKKIGLMKHRSLMIKDMYVEMESLISPW